MTKLNQLNKRVKQITRDLADDVYLAFAYLTKDGYMIDERRKKSGAHIVHSASLEEYAESLKVQQSKYVLFSGMDEVGAEESEGLYSLPVAVIVNDIPVTPDNPKFNLAFSSSSSEEDFKNNTECTCESLKSDASNTLAELDNYNVSQLRATAKERYRIANTEAMGKLELLQSIYEHDINRSSEAEPAFQPELPLWARL